MDNDFILVFITAPSAETARSIANMLVEKGLSACVNLISPIHSLFMWQGQMNSDEETLLIVKSRAGIFYEHLVPAVCSIHPYQVPEIIAIPISMAEQDYLHWMDETIQKNG